MTTVDESFLVGLIGSGVTGSLTPPLHEREADHHGLRYLYRPLDLARMTRPLGVGDLLAAGRDLGFNAFNVTHPCKQDVLAYLDEMSDEAARLGAVNTVLVRGGRFVGHNTDVTGYAAALREGLPGAALDSVVLVGAGGAGAAVGQALVEAGTTRLAVVDLQPQRAAACAALLRDGLSRNGHRGPTVETGVPADLPRLLATATGVVNASFVGMHTHPGSPVPVELLHDDLWVSDVVYRPLVTELVSAAHAIGARVLDGGWMAAWQAADAFALITGVQPDRARMRAHLQAMATEGR